MFYENNLKLPCSLFYAFFVVCCLVLPGLLCAEENDGYVCSFQAENDFFGGGTDRHFTHGTRLGCLTKPLPWITDAADKLPWFSSALATLDEEDSLKARAIISIGQNIYTPEDIRTSQLIPEDRPYGGWLYLGFGLVANQGTNRYDNIELNVGVVGPLSFAQDVQRGWHSMFDLTMPNGWDNQLDNEPGVNLLYDQAHRLWKKKLFSDVYYDFIPHFGFSIGNVFTHLSLGGTVRVGKGLERDFGPPRIRPSLPGNGYYRLGDKFSWYIFAGMEGRAVFHNIFLDGNTFAESHSVVKEFLVGDFQAGIALQFHRFRVSYIQIFRSHEYEGQSSADSFGAVNLSYHF